jgi:lethal(2) giant larvae protein
MMGNCDLHWYFLGSVREIPRPYLCSLHESPLTAIHHCANVPEDFWESLEHLAFQRLSAGHKVWPVTGGAVVPNQREPLRDLIITGHEDGSVRFWDVSSCFLGPLYRLSLAALFQNVDDSEMEGQDDSEIVDWPPFVKAGSFDQFCADQRLAVVKINFCPYSRVLTVGGFGGYVVMAMFNRYIQQSQMTVIDVAFVHANKTTRNRRIADSLTCRSGILTMKPGFQPQLCVLCQPTMPVTNVEISSDWRLIGIGTSLGVALIDYFQKQSILVKCTVEEDAPERSLWHFQSLRKSVRNSFRRLRSLRNRSQVRRRGQTQPKDQEPSADKRNGESIGVAPQGQRQRRQRLPAAVVREQDHDQEDKEKVRGNGVRSLHFADTFAYGPVSFPSLWAGTMSGHLFSFHIHFPSMQQQQSELLWAEQTAKEYHLQHGAPIIRVVALDHRGRPMPHQVAINQQQAAALDMTSPHFALIVTEEQLKVISLPFYKLKYKHKVSDINADPFNHSRVVVTKAGDFYLACLTQKGEFLAYSIPELHLLHRFTLLDSDDGRAMHKFVFTENGQVFYMSSPSQLQRVSLHPDTMVEPSCTLNPRRVQELKTMLHSANVTAEQSVESDQENINETFEHLEQLGRDSPFAEEPNRKQSSQSDASLDDDVQEISIDVAIRAQTSWSESYRSTPSHAATLDSNGHSQSQSSVRTKSENGSVLSPEWIPGKNLTDYHKPVTKSVSEPPKQMKRSIFDHREQLNERGEKLEGVVKTSRQTAEKAHDLAGKAAALVAQQERKPWWKV